MSANAGGRGCGGGEWESNPPRTGKRLFPGFEVRTPHRGRFSSLACNLDYFARLTNEQSRNARTAWPQIGSQGVPRMLRDNAQRIPAAEVSAFLFRVAYHRSSVAGSSPILAATT